MRKILLTLIWLSVCLCLFGCTLTSKPYTVKYIRYPVRPGDSIISISDKFGVSQAEIMQFNGIKDSRSIKTGQIIKIPWYKDEKLAPVKSKTGTIGSPLPPAVSADPNSLKSIKLNLAKKYLNNLTWPVKGGEMISPFGKRWLSFHEGIDIHAAEGEKIHAAHSGKVVYSGDGLRGYGNLIIVQADGLMTIYAHNSKNYVEVGDSVGKGQEIGEVGQTGKATGPHLHFETRIKDAKGTNSAVDPMAFYVVQKPATALPSKVKAAEAKVAQEKNKKENLKQSGNTQAKTPEKKAGTHLAV